MRVFNGWRCVAERHSSISVGKFQNRKLKGGKKISQSSNQFNNFLPRKKEPSAESIMFQFVIFGGINLSNHC